KASINKSTPPQPQRATIHINGSEVKVTPGTTILEAARQAHIYIPTLCNHPLIKHPQGNCRLCLVNIEGENGLKPACATECRDGQEVRTQTEEIDSHIKFTLGLLRASHPNACMTCAATGTCDFQDLCYRYQAPSAGDRGYVPTHPPRPETTLDTGQLTQAPGQMTQDPGGGGGSSSSSFSAVTFDPQKCIRCGRCVSVCAEVQGEGVIGFTGRGSEERVSTFEGRPLTPSAAEGGTDCIMCGQCAAVCSTGAMCEKDDLHGLLTLMADKGGRTVVVSTAPAVRVAVAEELGLAPGAIPTGQMFAALRGLGFDRVFDTNFTADLTVLEEASELVGRVVSKGEAGPLPMFTSCCPGWINMVEKTYPEIIPHLSTCKSPQQVR
ncbi:unnamed protein product, partial [Discosporangium mesarthrocarpum]